MFLRAPETGWGCVGLGWSVTSQVSIPRAREKLFLIPPPFPCHFKWPGNEQVYTGGPNGSWGPVKKGSSLIPASTFQLCDLVLGLTLSQLGIFVLFFQFPLA